MKKKVYYAHSMHLYDTKQELRDIEILEKLGFKVINPNTPQVQEGVEEYRKEFGAERVMEYFFDMVNEAEVFAFRAHPEGKIPSGVNWELNTAKGLNKLIIELPSLLSTRGLSVEDTKEYLKLLGQR